jgi:hypothetical protein
MKKYLNILSFSLFSLLCPAIVNAQNIIFPLDPFPARSSKNLSIGINCEYGGTYAAGGEDKKSLAGGTISFSLEGGYRFLSDKWIIISLAERNSEVEADVKSEGKTRHVDIYEKFIDTTISGRLIHKWWYGDIGLFYGYPHGSWSDKSSSGSGNVGSTGSKGRKKYEMGVSIGTGLLMPVTENIYFQGGLHLAIPFTASYNEGNTRLRNNRIELIAGIQYKL